MRRWRRNLRATTTRTVWGAEAEENWGGWAASSAAAAAAAATPAQGRQATATELIGHCASSQVSRRVRWLPACSIHILNCRDYRVRRCAVKDALPTKHLLLFRPPTKPQLSCRCRTVDQPTTRVCLYDHLSREGERARACWLARIQKYHVFGFSVACVLVANCSLSDRLGLVKL